MIACKYHTRYEPMFPIPEDSEFKKDCPDCLRKLAEEWAGRWGWTLYTPRDDDFCPRWLEPGEVDSSVYDHILVERVVSPDGMVKAWEWAEEQSYQLFLIGDYCFFRKTLLEPTRIYTEKSLSTEQYKIKKYGKVLAVMLAALEVPKMTNPLKTLAENMQDVPAEFDKIFREHEEDLLA